MGGVHVYVGHESSSICPMSRSASSLFTVIHTNGLHRLRLHFCNCPGAPKAWIQLVRSRLWPATVADPQTVVTFNVLRHFEKVNVFGHTTATDYYRAIVHMTDPTGLSVNGGILKWLRDLDNILNKVAWRPVRTANWRFAAEVVRLTALIYRKSGECLVNRTPVRLLGRLLLIFSSGSYTVFTLRKMQT
jgi:hypothetical protein